MFLRNKWEGEYWCPLIISMWVFVLFRQFQFYIIKEYREWRIVIVVIAFNEVSLVSFWSEYFDCLQIRAQKLTLVRYIKHASQGIAYVREDNALFGIMWLSNGAISLQFVMMRRVDPDDHQNMKDFARLSSTHYRLRETKVVTQKSQYYTRGGTAVPNNDFCFGCPSH